MIIGAEIAMTLVGLYMLIMGRTIGKDPVSHWQFRLLGGFLLTLLPVAFVVLFIVGFIWGMSHPDQSAGAAAEALRWPSIGIELGFVAIYVIIGAIWEKAIKRKALAQLES